MYFLLRPHQLCQTFSTIQSCVKYVSVHLCLHVLHMCEISIFSFFLLFSLFTISFNAFPTSAEEYVTFGIKFPLFICFLTSFLNNTQQHIFFSSKISFILPIFNVSETKIAALYLLKFMQYSICSLRASSS